MDFRLDQTYTLPPGEEPSWFRDALAEVRRIRVGEVRLNLHLHSGTMPGTLEGTDDGPDFDSQGTVYIWPPSGGDLPRTIPCEEIAGYTLLGGPPIDHSNELGRW